MTNNEIREGIEQIRTSANSLCIISNLSPTTTLKEFQIVLKEHFEKITQFEKEFNESIGEEINA